MATVDSSACVVMSVTDVTPKGRDAGLDTAKTGV
jgi:hypothetical protein